MIRRATLAARKPGTPAEYGKQLCPRRENLKLLEWKERWRRRLAGALRDFRRIRCVHYRLAVPVGTYKKAHFHGPGAHVVILGGQGYSLMYPQGQPIQRYDWKPGSMVVPPAQLVSPAFQFR